MKIKQSRAGTAAVKAAIVEMEAGKIVFTGADAEAAKHLGRPTWHIHPPVVACALTNHPELVHATDHEVLKLLPYVNAATLDENNAFEVFGMNDVADVARNIRRVTNDVPKYLEPVVANTSSKRFTILTTCRRAEFCYIVEANGQCRLDISPLQSDTEDFFAHLWSCLEHSRRERIRRCKCGRYFVAKTTKARFCSRTCTEGDKRTRYAQLPDRAEDQALSMMAVNYRRRYNGRSPSKQYAAKWLEAYRQKRQGKKPVSTRPVETVMAKL